MTNLILADALNALSQANSVFARLVENLGYDVSLYKPDGIDPQTPHKRDELYVIGSGSGEFICKGKTQQFRAGDAFFVEAEANHRFQNFSSDFSTWVIFFGPRPATGF